MNCTSFLPMESHDTHSGHSSGSRNWTVFGQRVPRSEIVFICQIVILYTVIVTSIYNLTRGHQDSSLWTALLSSSLGILVPNPKISKNSRQHEFVLPHPA